MHADFRRSNSQYEVEYIMTPTSWSYTQKLDLSELRYMVQILRSDNDVMQARCIRRMIELISRGIRQGFCDEIIEVINDEELKKMLLTRIIANCKELRMIRDVLIHILDQLPLREKENQENQLFEAEQVTDLEASVNISYSESEPSQIPSEEEVKAQLEAEVALLQQAIAEGGEHLYNKKWREETANHTIQRGLQSKRSFRKSLRNRINMSNGSGNSANSSKSDEDLSYPVHAIHANE
ncbi:MAG: hypothetical protein EZS28_010010 [Streblomastix strix]|uniref:Uncharacterized protein n=1 Tax=Streblomastix strix TaxID=222440 RepID=A0A5J4WHL2_9EUKA|nr:MAG: hypothetical protein EZS28_010010 [Streblomastix strix]